VQFVHALGVDQRAGGAGGGEFGVGLAGAAEDDPFRAGRLGQAQFAPGGDLETVADAGQRRHDGGMAVRLTAYSKVAGAGNEARTDAARARSAAVS